MRSCNLTKIARVALDVPVPTLFDYRCESGIEAKAGNLVVVPLGRKRVVGLVVELASGSEVPSHRLKPVERALSGAPVLCKDDLRLLRFAAAYYQHPLGPTVMGALPARMRRASAGRPVAAGRYAVTIAGEAVAIDALPPRAAVRRRLLSEFKLRRVLDLAAVKSVARTAPTALRQLMALGWVARDETIALHAPATIHPPSAGGPQLTAEQEAAVRAIVDGLAAFKAFLLLGVTGSGKTEVYLHAVDATLRAGRQALLLVPEIMLTPQFDALVRGRFPGAGVTTLHSGLNEGERLAHWHAAQRGHVSIVLGTRLAVFTPMPRLGLIVVDEEHDASFKQMDGLRYSARDLAVVRARQRSVPVVLGSATPALETYYNALADRYSLLTLRARIHAAPPRIECIDTRGKTLSDGLAPRLIAAIATRLARREQSLVFINRRGYAPVLMCSACGWLSGCHRCSAQLVLHLHDRRLHCHHCGMQRTAPAACPECGNADLTPVGQGTQRIEAAISVHFPHARVLRIDRDSTRPRRAWSEMRERIHGGEVDILVGTQILAKGHDFPHLNLVGVINADSMLYSSDFRAPERLYALLTQVAGRAGRGAVQGEVLIQTAFPSHPLYAALCRQDYAAFARQMLEERRQAGFPPFVHQALLRAEASKVETALALLGRAAHIGSALDPDIVIYDPVPAAMMRRAGRERAQLLVQAESRTRLQAFLGAWRERLTAESPGQVRWSLDVDPLEF